MRSLAVSAGLLLWLIDGLRDFVVVRSFLRAVSRCATNRRFGFCRFAFFITPIMWNASILEARPSERLLIDLNLFFYILEVVRAPLLGTPLTIGMAAKAVIVTAGLVGVSTIAFCQNPRPYRVLDVMMTHLTVFNISVDFPLYHSDNRSLKKTVLGATAGRFGQDHKRRPVVQALRDISFSLRSGDSAWFDRIEWLWEDDLAALLVRHLSTDEWDCSRWRAGSLRCWIPVRG